MMIGKLPGGCWPQCIKLKKEGKRKKRRKGEVKKKCFPLVVDNHSPLSLLPVNYPHQSPFIIARLDRSLAGKKSVEG